MVKRVLILMLLVSFCFTQVTYASTLDINFFSMFSSKDENDIINHNNIDSLSIKEFYETNDYYYAFVYNKEEHYGVAIAKINKSDISKNQIYSIYNTDIMKKFAIQNVYVDKDDNIWLNLSNILCPRICKISESKIDFFNCWFDNYMCQFGKDKILLFDNEKSEISSWNGKSVDIVYVRNDLTDFVEYEDKIYYTNYTGNVYRIDGNSSTLVFNIQDFLKIDKNTFVESIDLASAGGKLFVTAGFSGGSDSISYNPGLISITDNKLYSDAPIARIVSCHENGDNSISILGMSYVPTTPMGLFEPDYVDILLKDNKIVTKHYDYFSPDVAEKYIDKNSNTFTYDFQEAKKISGIVKTTPDDTSINYYFKTANHDKTSVKVRCNNTYVDFDSNPYIENGRTIVPIRGLMYILGGKSNWDNGTVTIEKGNNKIVLKIGSDVAYVNGNKVRLDVTPKIINGRTMVPLRFISENCSINVDWDSTAREVIINKQLEF